MHIMKRIFQNIHERGFLNTLLILFCRLEEKYFKTFDRTHGTVTSVMIDRNQLDTSSANKKYSAHYLTINHRHVYSLFNHLFSNGLISPATSFVDYGCGMGRVAIIASEMGFQNVVGIEYAKNVYEVACKNVERHQSSYPDRTVLVQLLDAVDYEIQANDCVFYFYNPFGKQILHQVLDKIERSFQSHKRDLTVIFTQSTLEGEMQRKKREIDQHSFLYFYGCFTFYGKPFLIYKVKL